MTQRLLLKTGYEAMGLQGVALYSPCQIPETQKVILFRSETLQLCFLALGVNSNSGVFYHGATAGFEYSF